MQMEPGEIGVVQISRTEYIMKCYHDMVDQIPPKRILTALTSMGVPLFTSATSQLKFTKDIPTCSSTDIYRICRTRHFRWKGECATEIQLLNTPHNRRRCRQAMTTLMQFDWRALLPDKNGAWTFATGVGGDSDTCYQDYVVTWQRRLRLLSIQALICF